MANLKSIPSSNVDAHEAALVALRKIAPSPI